jgi:hypothetical protein
MDVLKCFVDNVYIIRLSVELMKITLRVKKWSSSNVLVPPKKELENEGICPGDLVDVTITKKTA